MEKGVTCALCGGTDFYNDAGFFYCSECQLRSQDLHDQQFEVPGETLNLTKPKGSRKRTKKAVEQITSWECYNYILLGLVNELIDLGADERLKLIVQVLWFKYLKAINVLQDDPRKPPKLQAFNSQQDAEIVYGRSRRKRVYKRRTSKSSSSSSETNSEYSNPFSGNREHSKRKRAMIKAEYENSTQQPSSSLHNTSLSSLKSTEDSAKKAQGYLKFNKRAIKEMKKFMSKNHFQEHLRDTQNVLTCHIFSSKQFPASYRGSAEILTKVKLYAIIYLGLLLSKDKLQLGDILRFMYEGHLSFNNMLHFFPEEFDDKKLNIKAIKVKCHVYKHSTVRTTAGKVAVFLKLRKTLPMQNLLQMCERYCEELNLPEELLTYVISLITRTQPTMKLMRIGPLPNYEGRAMSFILFAMKLIFGMDGVTELWFSNLAALLQSEGKMFSFKDWLEHICYRDLVVQQHHFPAKFVATRGEDCPGTYVNFIENYHKHIGLETGKDMEYDILKKLLLKLEENNTHKCKSYDFPNSLTPFREYISVLIEAGTVNDNNYLSNILLRDFKSASLDFLFNPKRYLRENIASEFNGANADIELVPLFAAKPVKHYKREAKLMCRLVRKKDMEAQTEQTSVPDIKFVPLPCEKPAVNNDHQNGSYDRHYYPEKKFWLCSAFEIDRMTVEEYKNYFDSLPHSFQLVVKECSRVINQSTRELLGEYIVLETYMCYVFDGKTGKEQKPPYDKFIQKLVNKYKKFW